MYDTTSYDRIYAQCKFEQVIYCERLFLRENQFADLPLFLQDKQEKVIYISSFRDEICRKTLDEILLICELSGKDIVFNKVFDINLREIYKYSEPSSGYLSLLYMLQELFFSTREHIVIIEDPGKSLHAMFKSALIPTILNSFDMKNLIVSSWHEEIIGGNNITL